MLFTDTGGNNTEDRCTNALPYDGIVNDYGVLLSTPNALYHTLLNELNWQPDHVTLFGKTHITKRQTVLMGDAGLSYRYSGHRRICMPWHPNVFHVKQLIETRLHEQAVPCDFNCCLLNYYPTGMEAMGYHADNEPELGSDPIIASVSLGATRQFCFKHNATKHKVAMPLHSGQLIVMRGKTQHHWKHSITKTKKVNTGRISLTFRQLIS